MASKNQIKQYRPGLFYHLYNRGVEKRRIFMKPSDYEFFVSKMRGYLTPYKRHKDHRINITLLAYCLIPNHFHIVAVNESRRGIERFFRSLATSYSSYFNHKYNRVGPLFQGPYKAVLISEISLLLWEMRYVHRNPVKHGLIAPKKLSEYPYSNYNNYISELRTDWFNTSRILSYFSGGGESYREFVENSSQRKAVEIVLNQKSS